MRVQLDDITEGELSLLVRTIRDAARRYATTSRRPGGEQLRGIQAAKSAALERIAASLASYLDRASGR